MPSFDAALRLATVAAVLALSAGRAADQPAPDPLDRLARDVGAVLTPASEPRLQLTEDDHGVANTRTLGIGDEYLDGWRITAISPSSVALAKGAQARTVAIQGRAAPPPPAVADAPVGGKTATTNALPGGSADPKAPAVRANINVAIAQGDVSQVSALGGTQADVDAAVANTPSGYGVRTLNLRQLPGGGRTLILFNGVTPVDP